MEQKPTPEQMERAKRIVSENWPGSWSELNSYHAVAVDCALAAIIQSDQQLMEARTLVAEANNSLYGSQNYFHSTNGGPFDKHHLSRPIEALKERARKADQQQAELLSHAEAMAGALEQANDAIKEMFRYYDGGETRGSYDGKPERNQLRKAGYACHGPLYAYRQYQDGRTDA